MEKGIGKGTLKLIIAPHADDEILGCGGFLAKFGKECFVYYVGVEEFRIISRAERLEEIKGAANLLGFGWDFNKDTKVNNYKEVELIGVFEDLINKLKPEMILIPHPSYNQDHRAVFNAMLIALRPHDKNFFVKKVLVYEQPHSIIWDRKPLNPNYFIEIDIEKKIAAYKLEKSQVRSMRSPELLRTISKLRGAQINVSYAEAFNILRWVD